jgi:hypothetical protein
LILEIHNREFYDALLSLSKKAIHAIDTPDRPNVFIPKFKFIHPTRPIYSEIGEDFAYIVEELNSSWIYKLKEFETCKSIINSDERLSSHFNKVIGIHGFEKIRFNDKTFLWIITSIIEHSKPQEINIDYYNDLYNDFEHFIYSDTVPIVYQYPLTYFKSDQEVTISNQLSIKRMTMNEREQWANHIIDLGVSHTVMNTNFAVEYKIEAPKRIDQGEQVNKQQSQYDELITDKMRNLIYALRLLKRGYFDDYYLIKKINLNIPDKISKVWVN